MGKWLKDIDGEQQRHKAHEWEISGKNQLPNSKIWFYAMWIKHWLTTQLLIK